MQKLKILNLYSYRRILTMFRMGKQTLSTATTDTDSPAPTEMAVNEERSLSAAVDAVCEEAMRSPSPDAVHGKVLR
jgi:hypothetical protein